MRSVNVALSSILFFVAALSSSAAAFPLDWSVQRAPIPYLEKAAFWIGQAAPSVPGCSPSTVQNAGLCSVQALSGSTSGPRVAPTNVPGVNSLPSGCVFSGGNVTCSSSATLGDPAGVTPGWDFTGITGYFIVNGSSTVVDVYDAKFKLTCGAAGVGNTASLYGMAVPDTGNTSSPTVSVNYSDWDGSKCQTNVGVAAGWGGVVYAHNGASVTLTYNKFRNSPYDVFKCSNATLSLQGNYIQTYGWNQSADADAPQAISCNLNMGCALKGNYYDISDGVAQAQAHTFPGVPPNALLFNTVDTGSTQNANQVICDLIAFGWGDYGSTCCTSGSGSSNNGLPFNVISVCDNHAVSNTVATNATTAAGNNTLHFLSGQVPLNVVAGWTITNLTAGSTIPGGTTVVSNDGTTVVMSANAAGAGVGNPNSIKFDHPTASGYTLNLSITNSVIQPANSGTFTHGGNMTSSACLGTFSVVNYNTGATIAKPSF